MGNFGVEVLEALTVMSSSSGAGIGVMVGVVSRCNNFEISSKDCCVVSGVFCGKRDGYLCKM